MQSPSLETPRRILHVDDDPTITRIVHDLLSRHGFETTPLHDPRLALEVLLRQEFRVVLLDLEMPDISGISLLQQIKEYDGGVHVVMLTGVDQISTVLTTMRLGAEACFFKPVSKVDPLVECLTDVFVKIDRWWETLRDLTHRRKREATLLMK